MMSSRNGQPMAKTTKKKSSAKRPKSVSRTPKRLTTKGVEAARAETKAEEPRPVKGALPPPPPPPGPPGDEHAYRVGDAAEFGRNMARVGVRSRELVTAFMKAQSARSGR